MNTPSGGVPPARPHLKFTEEGRRIREVLSYSRRGSRLGPRLREAWEKHAERWVIPDEAVDDPDFDLRDWFGRAAPLVVEIGSGIGEATAKLAAARPDVDVLALEVWHPGVADTLGRLADAGAQNVRLLGVDAAWTFDHLLAPGSVTELWTFFPDPWPKTRHHKRRLITPEFVAAAARRLASGAAWRLATDWPAYAEQIAAGLDAEPLLDGGVTPRWGERPSTRFERRGLAAGRPVTDLTYHRV